MVVTAVAATMVLVVLVAVVGATSSIYFQCNLQCNEVRRKTKFQNQKLSSSNYHQIMEN